MMSWFNKINPVDIAEKNRRIDELERELQRYSEALSAEAESRRMAALANNSQSSIAFMNAQAALNISEGIKNGKVQTIVVPSNMTGLMIGK